jgi:hypothetical protein
MAVQLGISGRTGENNFSDLVLLNKRYKGFQVTQRKLIQVVPVQGRVDLPANTVGAAQVTGAGEEDVGKVISAFHSKFTSKVRQRQLMMSR